MREPFVTLHLPSVTQGASANQRAQPLSVTTRGGASSLGDDFRCVDDVLVRADSVVSLRNNVDGLTAETLTGRVVQLTRTDCPSTAQLALLEEIRSAEFTDDRFTKVVIAVEGRGKLAWRHESVDTLIDLILEHEDDYA
jgi:hypothetical protein